MKRKTIVKAVVIRYNNGIEVLRVLPETIEEKDNYFHDWIKNCFW